MSEFFFTSKEKKKKGFTNFYLHLFKINTKERRLKDLKRVKLFPSVL